MRSMIFSLLSGIALTLLMRGPAPAPASQSRYAPAEQELAEAITARVIEVLHDSLPVRGTTPGSNHVNGDDLTVIVIRTHERWPPLTRAAGPPSGPLVPPARQESNSPPARRP